MMCAVITVNLHCKIKYESISSPWDFKLIFLESFVLNYVLIVSRIEES